MICSMIEKIFHHVWDNQAQIYYIKKQESLYITVEIWFHVGSVDENLEEQGMAHMIEHLLFKGSNSIAKGELDALLNKMSGSSNAFTSKDYTAYIFSVPKIYFVDLMNILSALFSAPSFKEEDIAIEKKIVAQEIDLYADDPFSVLIDKAFLTMDMQYNYRYPILGTHASVASFTSEGLRAFYQKYYTQQNMIFFVTGDITFYQVKKAFSGTYFLLTDKKEKVDKKYIFSPYAESKKESNQKVYYGNTLNNHFLLTFLFPNCYFKDLLLFKSLNLLLGGGKDSLLYQKLALDLGLVTDVKSFFYGMMKETFFLIYFNPVHVDDANVIITYIFQTIHEIIDQKYSLHQLERIMNVLEFQQKNMLSEEIDEFVHMIAPYAFDKKYDFFKIPLIDLKSIKKKISVLAKNFLKKLFQVTAFLKKDSLQSVQNDIIYDEKITTDTSTSTLVESFVDQEKNDTLLSPLYRLLNKKIIQAPSFDIVYEKKQLNCGIVFLFPKAKYRQNNSDEILFLYIHFKVKYYFQEVKEYGSLGILFDLMEEGTERFPGKIFAETVERYGIEFIPHIGSIEVRFLKKYCSIALALLSDYILRPELKKDAFDRVKMQTREHINNFLDDPGAVALQYVRELIYQGHPYGQNPSGTLKALESLDLDQVKKVYEKYISSDNLIFSFVGGIDPLFVEKEIEVYFASCKNNIIPDVAPFIFTKNLVPQNVGHVKIEKEQAVLIYAGVTVKKYTPEYYHLLIADELFGGGINHSMHCEVFQLRENSGFFYDISSSFLLGAGKIEGMFCLKAMTDPMYAGKAKKLIDALLETFYKKIKTVDIAIAKKTLLYGLLQKTETKAGLINTMLDQYRYGLTEEMINNNYISFIKNAKITDIKETVKKFLKKDNIINYIFANN